MVSMTKNPLFKQYRTILYCNSGSYKTVLSAFLYCCKIFDGVDHFIILSKWCIYESRGTDLEWLISYLFNRLNNTVVNDIKSNSAPKLQC